MSILVAARGAGRSGFPVYMRTVSIYSNNYRKLHGMSMMRHVHLRKIEKKRINKFIEEWIAAFLRGEMRNVLKEILEEYKNNPGPILTPGEMRYVLGIDLAEGQDFSTDACFKYYANSLYGQKVINQNAVVKIVTSGEENGDE